MFPKNALAIQKAWLRRSSEACKPYDMNNQCWTACLIEINKMLAEFSPAYSGEQKIREDDFIEIAEYSITQKWKAEMVRQSYVPTDHHLAEFTEFCEKLEVTELMLNSSAHKYGKEQGSKPKDEPDGTHNNSGSLRNVKTSHGRKNKGKIISFIDSDGKDGCAYHTHANGHNEKLYCAS